MRKAVAVPLSELVRLPQLARWQLYLGFYIATVAWSWALLPGARTAVGVLIATLAFWAIAAVGERPRLAALWRRRAAASHARKP